MNCHPKTFTTFLFQDSLEKGISKDCILGKQKTTPKSNFISITESIDWHVLFEEIKYLKKCCVLPMMPANNQGPKLWCEFSLQTICIDIKSHQIIWFTPPQQVSLEKWHNEVNVSKNMMKEEFNEGNPGKRGITLVGQEFHWGFPRVTFSMKVTLIDQTGTTIYRIVWLM